MTLINAGLPLASMDLIPPELVAELRTQLPGDWDDLLDAFAQPAPVSVRINPLKPLHIEAEQIPWCCNGRYLSERPQFTLDPHFHAGRYYVQEASSMMLETVFHASGLEGRTIMALDLCSAPGGKSTHLRSLLDPGSLLVCNEPDPARRAVLLENVWKWGHGNTIVTGSPAGKEARLAALFDLVLVDAPCSGEGMMRRDPFAREQWTPDLVRQCARDQHGILDTAWSALRPGGTLIYSTCTWEFSENEKQMERFVEAYRAEHINIPKAIVHGAVSLGPGIRCYPHRIRGEGLYLCALRKPGNGPSTVANDSMRSAKSGPEEDVIDQNGVQCLLDPSWHRVLPIIAEHLRIHSTGIPIGTHVHGSTAPHPAAAFNRKAMLLTGFETLEVDRDDALTFLRGEVIRDIGASGWRLITHDGHGLGWVKGAGLRWNNHHPKAWRIRKR